MTINTNSILNNLQMNLIKISAQEKVDGNTADKMIHDSLESDIHSSNAEIMNFNEAVGYMQVADGVLNGISKQTDELNRLSVSSRNGILNSDQESMITSQMDAISHNISKTISETTFNGKNVFGGDFNVGDMSINLGLNTDSLDVKSQDSIQDFTKQINSIRGDIGAFMNSANSNIDNLTEKVVNEARSKANFEPDIAKTTNNIKKDELNLTASTIAMAHNGDLLAQQIKTLLE